MARPNLYCEKVLDIDPKNAEAYLGKLMAELQVRTRNKLAECNEPFDKNENFAKVIRFGDEKIETELHGYIESINKRNEVARLSVIYCSAKASMKSAVTESKYKETAQVFQSIKCFKDSDKLAKECLEKAEDARKNEIYNSAMECMKYDRIYKYEEAIKIFKNLSGWKDVDDQLRICQERINTIREEEETAQQLKAKRAVEREEAAKKAKKRFKTIVFITLPIICVCIAFIIALNVAIIPLSNYKKAISLKEDGKFTEAIAVFEEIGNFKDSKEQVELCEISIKEEKYNAAIESYNNGNYSEAIAIFTEIKEYKDSVAQIKNCNTAIKDEKYAAAVNLYNEGKYNEAITAFTALNGYKDSVAQIENCNTAIKDEKYAAAVNLYNEGKYDEAITAFTALNEYKDSVAQIENCNTAIKDEKYADAVNLYNEGKYDEAITAFTALNGYRDSVAQIENCSTAIKNEKYAAAVDLYKAEKYNEAIAAFTALNGYKDSVAQIKKCKYGIINISNVGDTILFGSYEQDNNTSNGKEEIEWRVLAKEDNRILVISEYALDCKKYNTSFEDVTWETCSLRTWLNSSFLDNAFSADEQAKIKSTTVTADKNPDYSTDPGKDTTDKVFLLSITEAKKYFTSDEDRKCLPTAYAIAQDASTSVFHKKGGKVTCYWLLRSPGLFQDYATNVSVDGSVFCNGSGVGFGGDCVRPALWITLNS